MKKIFSNARLWVELSTLLIVSSVGLIVYADLAPEEIVVEVPNNIYELADEQGFAVKTIIFGNTGITIMRNDKYDYHYGTKNSGDPYNTNGNDSKYAGWGGSNDNYENGYSPNPTNFDERQGPCDTGYHVPSAGEWSKLLVSWCSLESTNCNPNTDLSYSDNNTFYDGKLARIASGSPSPEFQQTFNLYYPEWSSSLIHHEGNNPEEDYAYILSYSDGIGGSQNMSFNSAATGLATSTYNVRCMRNEVLYPYYVLTFNGNGGTPTTASLNVTGGTILNLSGSEYKATKQGFKFVGWSTNTGANPEIVNSYVATGNMTLYAIFREDTRNTAKLTPNDDGSTTITYSGVSYTLAGSDAGAYEGGDYHHNDTAENGYSPNPTNFDERQGPCDTGYHVPSVGEWGAIIKAWCHLSSNNCEESDLINSDHIDTYGNLTVIWKPGIGTKFKEDFNMGETSYMTSSDGTFLADQYCISPHNSNQYNLPVRCMRNHYTITFDANEGNIITSAVQIEEGKTLNLSGYKASRDGYDFVGWNTSSTASEKLNDNYVVKGNVTLYAIFQKKSSGGGSSSRGGSSSSGGGGRKSHNAATTTDKQQTSVDTGSNAKNDSDKSGANKSDSSKESSSNESSKGQKVPDVDMAKYNSKYSFEMNQAYQFAYAYGITNKSNIANANMGGKLTRIQMAKMLSTYAINVLGKEPDYSRGTIKFSDVSNNLDRKYSNGVTLAYQLGIMGQNIRSGKFRPYDEVTRAEFGTALSRLLYETKDGQGRTKYYEPHLAKLYNEGIIAKREPTMKEKRGYVMLMLTRSAE